MMKQDAAVSLPKVPLSGHPVLRRNAKGLIPNFWTWFEWLNEAAQLYFPLSFKDLVTAPAAESEEQALMRIGEEIPDIPLEDEKYDILSDADYALVALVPTAEERARALSIAVYEMQKKIRAANAVTSVANQLRGQLRKQKMARLEALLLERPKLAAWVVSDLVMPPGIHDEIKADGKYIPGEDGIVPAHVIIEIACRVLGGVSKNNTKQRLTMDDELKNVKQGNMPTHAYCQAFKRAHVRCVYAGTKMDPADVIACFVYGLNLQIYELYIKAFNADTTAVPDNLGAVMADALAYLQSAIEVNPSLSKVLDHSSKAFVAYSTEEVEAEDLVPSNALVSSTSVGSTSPPPPPVPTGTLKCQLCLRKYHDARSCFKLGEAEFIKKLVEALPARGKSKGAPGGTTAEAHHVNASADRGLELTWPTDPSLVVCSTAVAPMLRFDLEHDDHAQVSVINESCLALLASVGPCEDRICGVVPGAGVNVSLRGYLLHDMGRAMVIPGANRLLASGQELRERYNFVASDLEIKYTHKIDGSVLIFRCDPVRFKDKYYHLLLEVPLLSSEACPTDLDFYNPPPLAPVPPALESLVWPLIRAVERFHWTTGHMGAEDMKRMCQAPSYIGEVTPAAVDLFVSHRGCPSCLIGNMKAHNQLVSSRGLSTVVGAVFQGDIFFVEADESKLLVPILISVCEASLFMYLHVFVDTLARAQGKKRLMVNVSEMQNALDGLTVTCANAGHPIQELRFDRESAIAGTSIGPWLKTKGVDLSLTGAGQKLGLAEVSGRIVKDRCRSTLAGIQERFGYKFPAKWIPRVVADVICILNRTTRRSESLSPSQKFFGKDSAMDLLRDLRAPIGEILLFKKPKRTASSPISVMKAEWGIVVGRSFDRRGVLEVYLIESKSYGHRFKFARVAVSSFVMTIARSLCESSVPIVHEPIADHPEAGDDSMPCVTDSLDSRVGAGPSTLEDVLADLPNGPPAAAEEFSALSSQVSYRKALLESPDRATPAMVKEIESLFSDKKLGRPIRFRDIPEDQRKFILRSLDGYKEKYGPDGEWIKSKARLFVDGSRQLPDYTAESSSPVARMESVFMLASIAAYRGWEVLKYDVVCGYPNAARPPEVQYKYLRVSKEVAAIIVDLFPTYAEFLGRDGSLIVELDKMLYGMKEAGYYFYLLMFDMFRADGFITSRVDPCVIHRFEAGWEAHGAVSVDDCFFAVSSPDAKKALDDMFTAKFGPLGFTVQAGNRIDLLGLLFEFDRVLRRVLVSQRNFAAELVKRSGMSKFAAAPSGPDLFEPPIDSPPVKDPDLYRSLNQSYAFAASRTYPECLPSAAVYASRFIVATEGDFDRLLKSISYLGHDPDHCLVLHPGSLSLVASADASYGVHVDGKSHSGICVGFKGCDGVQDSFFIFSSCKQSIVTTSSCEAELVCSNVGASYVVWAAQLLEGFRLAGPSTVAELSRNAENTPYAHEIVDVPQLYQDNASTIHLIEKGRGNFRNSKHIRVRYYYIRELVLAGELKVLWQSTVDMVSDLLSKGTSLSVFHHLLSRLIGKR